MILLHIGSPKAGSTTIQHYLGRAGPDETGAEQLQAFGIGNAWRLAAAADTPATFRYWVERHALMTPQEHARNQGDIWDRARAEVAGRSGRTFLASSEYMYSLWGSDAAALRGMRTALEEIFGAVRILVYLREQVGFLKSNYAQLVTGRSRSTLSYDAYVAGLEERRGFWDYWGTLSVWAEVFGEVVVFDPRAFEGGDLLADFRHRIGAAVQLPVVS